jgi:hypothetical protein
LVHIGREISGDVDLAKEQAAIPPSRSAACANIVGAPQQRFAKSWYEPVVGSATSNSRAQNGCARPNPNNELKRRREKAKN